MPKRTPLPGQIKKGSGLSFGEKGNTYLNTGKKEKATMFRRRETSQHGGGGGKRETPDPIDIFAGEEKGEPCRGQAKIVEKRRRGLTRFVGRMGKPFGTPERKKRQFERRYGAGKTRRSIGR